VFPAVLVFPGTVYPCNIKALYSVTQNATQGKRKAPAYNRGYKIIYSFSINQTEPQKGILKYIKLSILYTS